MKKQSLFLALALIPPILAGGGGTAVADDERSRPAIPVESDDDVTRLWVDVVLPDGTAQRRLLRETSAAVHPTASGWGPAGIAGFTTWEESGARWFSYSRDGGETWSQARPLSHGLRLRDGEVAPDDRMPDAPGHLSLPPGGGLYLVQLKTISLPEWRAALESAGAEVLTYFPDNAHVVRLGDAPAARIEALAGLEIVERIEPYHPWYRLSAELQTWLEGPGEAAPERMRVRVVTFQWGPAGKGRVAELAGDLGAEIVELPPSGHVIELNVDREQLVQTAAHDDVEWIERWAPPQVIMDLMRDDSGADWLESNYLSEVDNLGYCGQGVRGEVMDAGIWDAHPDFDPIEYHGPYDVDEHGTSTYGVVFGRGYGDPRARGVLPCGEGIYAMWGPSDRYAHTAELKQSPYFASFQTNSWVSVHTPVDNDNPYTSVAQEMDDIIWRLDIAILNSQGNYGTNGSGYQAIAKNIISVGGIRHYDTLDVSDDAWAGSASVGPAQDGRIKPDVSYWYDNIFTTDLEPGGYTPDSVYTPSFGGTSAAAPEVAGVLGLMLQMWSENVWGTDPQGEAVFDRQPHFSTLKALLINNAQQYPFDGEAHDLSRHKQGWGRPSVRVAAERAAHSFIVDQNLLLEVGELASYRIVVAPGETELKITMVYPDPPGNPASSVARVNDLDLRVISPSGDVYHGNVGLTAGNASVPGGATDRIDTVENVFVVDPEPGTWSVAVEAAEINEDACPVGHESICGPTPGGTQEADATFSLVVTGGTGSASCTAPNAEITYTPNPARIGDVVQFQSTVSGGAGGPYSYWWDIDEDGVADSTGENTAYVYARPFEGPAKLWVADAENCPVAVRETVTVNGPNLWYDSNVDLTEVVGNANGGIDPGETWELTINLRNDGNESAEGVSADLSMDPASPVSVTLLQAGSPYADIGAGEAAPSDLAYRLQVDSLAPCGEWIWLSLTARSTNPDDTTHTYPIEVGVIRLFVGGTGPAVAIFADGFEQDGGWTEYTWSYSGEWERGEPLGLGGAWSDPDTAYEGQFVLGNDLTGLGATPGGYESDVGSDMRSPWIDIEPGVRVTEVEFARWLNVSAGDQASVHVSGWTTLPFTQLDGWSGVNEDSWTPTPIDLSDLAAGASRLRFTFRVASYNQETASGWNIDAFELRGVLPDSCEPYAPVVRYDSYSGLTEIDGNGNAVVDPGETWEMFIHLRNDGVLPAVGVSADLTADPATPGSVFWLQNGSDYGTIDPGEVVSSFRAYRFRLADDFPCGGEVVVSVIDITSDNSDGSYADAVGVIRIPVGEIVSLFRDGFEEDRGWTEYTWGGYGSGEWERGEPLGLGGAWPDPDTAYEGQSVLGNDLTGLGANPGGYESDVGSDILSPWIDIEPGVRVTELEFARWLNVAPGDLASVNVNGGTALPFTELDRWSGVNEDSWTPITLDLWDLAGGASRLQFRFRVNGQNQETASGWNVDAFELRGRTCEAFQRALPGEATHLLMGKGPLGHLTLEWTGDCGAATTYGIYRGDLLVGYDSIVTEPGQCDVAATSATIPEGSGDAEFFLVVPHKDGEEGSYGTDSTGTPRPPASGGCYPQGAVDACAP